MTEELSSQTIQTAVEKELEVLGIGFGHIYVRRFPGETIVVVEVPSSSYEHALQASTRLDNLVPNGFVTFRRSSESESLPSASRVASLSDPRVTQLVELLNARSRTSEQQPSLQYVKDAAEWLRVAVTKRHHLIFGRRGVGKTALMLEAKRLIEKEGGQVLWVNVQSMRTLSPEHAFLSIAARLCDIPGIFFGETTKPVQSPKLALAFKERVLKQLSAISPNAQEFGLIISGLQQTFNLFGHESSRDIYVFVDDFHYLPILGQARFLDLIHAVSRDNAIWIKAAAIKHQSRWFTDNPPVGLQTTHDAAIINLDITLENPSKAETFLTNILQVFARQAKISSIGSMISGGAIDRLVIASGAVPRDFLLLCASSIQVARERPKAKAAGVQDVNEAAGRAAKIKMHELEEDAASTLGSAESRLKALVKIRTFLLDVHKATYFRVEFRDKEQHPSEYSLLQSLMDLRLIHLINSSLSDEHHAGRRYEVYALDLSEFSGARLKLNLRALDFSRGHLVVKKTGSRESPRVGDTPKRLLGILRRGPHFRLEEFGDLVSSTPAIAPA